jgi:hypothetical protein
MSRYNRSSNEYTSIANKASGTISTDSGSIISITVCNTSNIDLYLMLFDNPVTPVNGDAPYFCIPVYSSNGFTEISDSILTESGKPFDTGLSWGISSTPNVLTQGQPTDAIVYIRWV